MISREKIEAAIEKHLATGGKIRCGTYGLTKIEGKWQAEEEGCCALSCLILGAEVVAGNGPCWEWTCLHETTYEWSSSFMKGFDGISYNPKLDQNSAYALGRELRAKYLEEAK